MNIVNEYKIKEGITKNDILAELKDKHITVGKYGTYIHPDAKFSLSKELVEDISVNIAFPKDLSKWDSFDYVLIMDENCGQPYYPFYKADEDNAKPLRYALNVIGHYNEFMDKFTFLERLNSKELKEMKERHKE